MTNGLALQQECLRKQWKTTIKFYAILNHSTNFTKIHLITSTCTNVSFVHKNKKNNKIK